MTNEPAWPPLDDQIGESVRGTALERLIRDNQDFSLLEPSEATDRIGLPPWLRVHWRKQHPDLGHRPDDPALGYPLALKNLHAWMLTHPDLRPEPGEPTVGQAAAADAAVAGAIIGANLRISGVQTTPCSEPDIALNINDTILIIAGANAGGGSRQAQFFSADSGATWGQTTLPLALTDTSHSDPAVGWTSDGTAWATTIGIQGANVNLQVRAYKSGDGGQTWSFDDTPSASQTATDKAMMWVDSSASSSFRDNIYVIWWNSAPAFVSRRTGPAGSWQAPVQVSGAETTGSAIGGAITTNSAGDVFAMWPDTTSRNLWVAKSTDGGASFSSPVAIATTFAAYMISVPSFGQRHALIYLSAGANSADGKDLVYAVWTDLTGASGCSSSADAPDGNVASACKTRIWFSRSTDGGTTWATAIMINNQASLNDQFHPRLVVDQTTGTLVVIYYDTVDDPGRLKTDVWFQSSSDDGLTWSAATKVTTSQTDETAAGASVAQYGEYNGLTGFAGTFFPAWTDRRGGALEEVWTAPITVPPAPVVTAISPSSGSAAGGSQVTITGSGFTGATDVGFGITSAAALNVDSDTQITTASPAGTGTVDVTVTTPAGTSATTPADQYTYVPVPQVAAISPSSGSASGGDQVTITGSGFTGATDVGFGPTSGAALNVDNDTQITTASPAGTGTVDVTVTTPAGTSATTPADQYTYLTASAAPQVTAISPTSGSAAGGDQVTITGSGFTGATDVGFGLTSATALNVDNDTQITTASPAGTGTVDVTVTTPAGTSATTPADQYTYM